MKKILIIPVVLLLVVLGGCSQDKSNNCPCDGSYGTNFYGLSADSSCAAWKARTCPKNYTCTCTLGAPTSAISNTDSATAAKTCNYTQSKLQNLYPGTVCGL